MTPFGSDAHRLLRAVRRVVVLMIATITLMSSPMVSTMRKRCDLLALAPPALATITDKLRSTSLLNSEYMFGVVEGAPWPGGSEGTWGSPVAGLCLRGANWTLMLMGVML